jgi:hypothetical protein
MKKIKPLKKSKKNTSNRKSAAKREAEARAKKAKASKSKTTKVTTKKRKTVTYNIKLSGLNPAKPKQLPDTPLSRRGLSLKKLLRGTPKLFIHNSNDVIITKLNNSKTKSGMPAVSAVAYTSDPHRPMKTRRYHNLHIIGLDKNKDGDPDTKKPITKHDKVLVSCGCESYVFGGAEYANAAHGAARIVYGNGNPPVVTNPMLVPFLCKHAVALATAMFKSNL